MKSWRDGIDKSLKEHLELQVRETALFKNAYTKADNPVNAQLWVAIANLSKQMFDLNLKVKFLEKILQEIARPKVKKDVKELKKSLKKF